jgi:hypothetical protein
MALITIIGRGHSGTRAISQTLHASDVFMGNPLNKSGDLLPPEKLYEACRVLGQRIRYAGNLEWDFSGLQANPLPTEFTSLVESYLSSVLQSKNPNRGWKLPETTLIYPWIVRMFPDARYIFWVRHPFDSILGDHLTDDLAGFGVPAPDTEDLYQRRAVSWLYHHTIQQAFPRPAHFLEVRYEDFVLKQKETLQRLEDFLRLKLAVIPVHAESVNKWDGRLDPEKFTYLYPALEYHGYVRQSQGLSTEDQATGVSSAGG